MTFRRIPCTRSLTGTQLAIPKRGGKTALRSCMGKQMLKRIPEQANNSQRVLPVPEPGVTPFADESASGGTHQAIKSAILRRTIRRKRPSAVFPEPRVDGDLVLVAQDAAFGVIVAEIKVLNGEFQLRPLWVRARALRINLNRQGRHRW